MWVLFALIVVVLWSLMKEDHEPIVQVATTVVTALIWGAMLGLARGWTVASQFYSGYIMEWALSVDNLMAIALVFAYFKLPKAYESRILSVGIASAVAFRLLFTLVGASLLSWGRPIEVVFGVLVGLSAWKMLATEGDDNAEVVDHNSRWYIRCLRRWIPITGDTSKPVFFTKIRRFMPKEDETLYATPLLACLVAIEITDVMFSFDSVPAVIAVSRTPLVIYSAMIFAIIGLRQMYFVLQEAKKNLAGLPTAVAAVLVFLSLKMVISGLFDLIVPAWATLVVVLGMLAWGIKGVRSGKLQQK